MAADAIKRAHVGFHAPSSIPLGTHHNTDPSHLVNQLQFNLRAPYSINSLASNFKTPQPLVIEKFPVFSNEHPKVQHRSPIPSSPASSVSSERLHFAVQLAKIDAKKLWRQQKESEVPENLKEVKSEVKQDKRNLKTTEVKGTRKITQDRKRPNVGYSQYKHKKDHDVRRSLHEYHQVIPDSEDNKADKKPFVGSEEKQTREIKRLEKQIQNYLRRLDDLIHKGHEVVQKKDKRLHVRRNDKDDMSHLSDEDTDPRQYERAEEQATRSARVLYMIERQIRELDDEIRKKGKNMKQSKKSETLGRLAAAQRATVRALRMLINSAPLQPKRSQHYPSIYQALTSLIQQLSLLAIQIEDGDVEVGRKAQDAEFDGRLRRRSNPNSATKKTRFGSAKAETRPLIGNKHAFFHEPERDFHDTRYSHSKYQPSMQRNIPDDSTLTIDPTPERNATLKAGLEALLRARELERKSTKPVTKEIMPNRANTKKKAVLLPSALQAKRRKAYIAVQKSVKFPSETAHFTKETTASRLKKVEKQKTKEEMKYQKTGEDASVVAVVPGGAEAGSGLQSRGTHAKAGHEIDHQLHGREIDRQLWLEDQSRKKLQEVMDIPKNLVSEAEDAIKKKLRPLLDQAQAVVDSSKAKPVQERFANIASEVTMKENEVLSEMILDDLLIDTAQEFQSLERNEEVDEETSFLQNNSTLENILQRLEHFEKEEESIRRHLNEVSYEDLYETKQRRNIRQNYKDERENVTAKDSNEPTLTVRPSSLNYTRTSTVFNPVDRHPVSFFLPSKVRENIFSYREKYSEHLKKTNAGHHGTFDPWQLVERLSDEILEEMISEVASEFTGACDDVTEMLFKSEFMKE